MNFIFSKIKISWLISCILITLANSIVAYFIIFRWLNIRFYFLKEGQSQISPTISKIVHFSRKELNQKIKSTLYIKKGKSIFLSECASCHGKGARGGSAPNLTDQQTIYPNYSDVIYSIIYNGIEEKGMPSFKNHFSKEELVSIVAFINSIYGTHPISQKDTFK